MFAVYTHVSNASSSVVVPVVDSSINSTVITLDFQAGLPAPVHCGVTLPFWNNTVNVTRGSSTALLLHSDHYRPNLDITGTGTAMIRGHFSETHGRQLLAGVPPRPHLTISDPKTIDSTIRWGTGVTPYMALKLHDGHTAFNLSSAQHTNIIDLWVKQGAGLTLVDPVWTSANIDGNVMLVDQALEVTLEVLLEAGANTTGAHMSDVPVDTSGAAVVSVASGAAPAGFLHPWILGKGSLAAASSSVNLTSASSDVFVHTIDRLPFINVTGYGDVLINPVFLANRSRYLTVHSPPLPQLTISDSWPVSTISWKPNVTGTLNVDLNHGNTIFTLNNQPLERTITVRALSNAPSSVVVPVDTSINSTVITLDFQAGVLPVPSDCGPTPAPPWNNTVNVTRGSSTALLLHSDTYRPNLEITGHGYAVIHKHFSETHDRHIGASTTEPHIVITDPKTTDSTIHWDDGVTTSMALELHDGHTYFNLSAAKHTNIIDMLVKQGGGLTLVDPVHTTANIDGNVMLVDQALRVTLEAGANMTTVPVDTSGAAVVSLACGSAANSTVFNGTQLPQDGFLHPWILGKGSLTAASSTANFTSASSRVFVHTIDRLPFINVTGYGDVLINPVFLANRSRYLTVHSPPLPQLNISDGWPVSTISWMPSVTGTLKIDLYDGDTTFKLNGYLPEQVGTRGLIMLNAHQDATVTLADPSTASAMISGNTVQIDAALEVAVGSDANPAAVAPISTDDSMSISITLDDSSPTVPAMNKTLWRFAKYGVLSDPSIDIVNVTTATNVILAHSTDRLPNINIGGHGSTHISATFNGIRNTDTHKRELELSNPPLAQLTIKYNQDRRSASTSPTTSTVQWTSNVSAIFDINLQQGATNVLIDAPQLVTVPTLAVPFGSTASITPAVMHDSQIIELQHAGQNLPDVISNDVSHACFNAMQQCARYVWADDYIRSLEQGECRDTDNQCSDHQILMTIDTEQQLESISEGWQRLSSFDVTFDSGIDTADTESQLQCTKWRIDIPASRSMSKNATYPIILLFVASILYAILRFLLFHVVSIQTLYCMTILTVLPILQDKPLPLHLRAMTQAADVVMSDWWYMLDYVDCGSYGYYTGLGATVFLAVMLLAVSWYRLSDRDEKTSHVVFCCAAHRPAQQSRQSLLRSMAYMLLGEMRPEERKAALAAMTPIQQASAIGSMSSEEQEDALDAMSPREQAAVLGAMSRQKKAAAFAAIGTEKQAVVLAAMSLEMREAALEVTPVFRRQEVLELMDELLAKQASKLPALEEGGSDSNEAVTVEPSRYSAAAKTYVQPKEDLDPQSGVGMGVGTGQEDQVPDMQPGVQLNPIFGGPTDDDSSERKDNPEHDDEIEADDFDEEDVPLSPKIRPRRPQLSCSEKCAATCESCCESEHDPQRQAPFVKCYTVILVLGMVVLGTWRKFHEDHRPRVALFILMVCLEIVLACLGLIIRRRAPQGHDDRGQIHVIRTLFSPLGWRLSLSLCALVGHISGVAMMIFVYLDIDERISIVLFVLYWSCTCALEFFVYIISWIKDLCDNQYSKSQNIWRLSILYNLRDRFVALLWTASFILCVIAIPSRLFSVIGVIIVVALGYLYQYLHHCREYRSRLSRVSELEWANLDESDDEEEEADTVGKHRGSGVHTELRSLMPGVN